jgi:aminopeptidase N
MLAGALLFLLQSAAAPATAHQAIRADQDILAYEIGVSIPDTGTAIVGHAALRYVVRGGAGPLVLDFDSVLTVDSILTGAATRRPVDRWEWLTDAGHAGIAIHHWGAPGDTLDVHVHYHGSARDGLFIQDNVHGARTAFADNWPNRARHWFPGEDHPSDKATAAFTVEVPAGWHAVANGLLEGIDTLPSGRSVWRWRESRPIPTYTMVVGAGALTVADVGEAAGIRQTLWTFPQDSAFAVDGPFRRVGAIVDTLAALVGPFPYGKLAHVQSSTRFGGMENSSAIFYGERGYAQRSMREPLVVHEVAHQWFGDAVTPHDWPHLWISEGFATYFAALFYELVGEDSLFVARMAQARRNYLESSVVDRPVIDVEEADLFALLNANNYQKGAWVLHMLRREVADSTFFGGLREYYATYRDSTALTRDFAALMGRRAGRSLSWFFRQWLDQPGYPKLEGTWSRDPQSGALRLRVRQVQPAEWGHYRLTLPVAIELPSGETHRTVVELNGPDSLVQVGVFDASPTRVVLDPDRDLLVDIVSITEGTTR